MQLARRIGLTPARLARRAAPALALRSASRVLAMMSLPLVATAAVFLLAAPTAALPRTVRVGPSASADAPTISGGLRLVPPHQTARWTLVVEPGVYRERVWVNSSMGPLTLKGTSSPEHTLLVFHCCPAGDGTKGCSNATADPACIPQHVGAGMTRGVETLLVEAADFVLSNLAVANDACQYDNRKAGQSEALQLLADRTLVTNSQLLGAQDTLYSGGQSVRQYIVDTYINGSVDSIYGESTMVIERCEIAITDHVTAAKSGPNDIYLISQSRLVKPVPGQANYPAATGKTELGRAWGAAAHVPSLVNMHCAALCVLCVADKNRSSRRSRWSSRTALWTAIFHATAGAPL